MTDLELLRIYKPAHDLQITARKYNKIAKVGGCLIFAFGIGGSIICHLTQDSHLSTYLNSGSEIAILSTGLIAGTAWYFIFNYKSKSLLRQAKEQEMYSSTLIENELLRFGDKSLLTGLNVMGNRLTHTQSFGLSLKLNF